MKKKKLWSRALVLFIVMNIFATTVLAGCTCEKKGRTKKKIITLRVSNELSSFIGAQTGWMADVLKKKFNVKLMIESGTGINEEGTAYEQKTDIVVWNSVNSEQYKNAVTNNLLYDWEKGNLLKQNGKYIAAHLEDAINENKKVNEALSDGKEKHCYGICQQNSLSSKDHGAFYYTWDIRWDLYKKLGYPEVNDLDDLADVLANMQKICSTDDKGGKTYGMSLWEEKGDYPNISITDLVSAYYGYPLTGLCFYNQENNTFHPIIDNGGVYCSALKFYNKLYRSGVLDPNSQQDYTKLSQKIENGSSFFCFNINGSKIYNTQKHLQDGKMMYSLKPKDALPLVWETGENAMYSLVSISADTKYPELCMKLLNYFASPEGTMTIQYGTKGTFWDYDKEGHAYFTELGSKCQENGSTKINNKETYFDGVSQAGIYIVSREVNNPQANNETYNSNTWKSEVLKEDNAIQKDWRQHTGCLSYREYFEKSHYQIIPNAKTPLEEKSSALSEKWNKVIMVLNKGSWKVIYAKTDQEFQENYRDMIADCMKSGGGECTEWSKKMIEEGKIN